MTQTGKVLPFELSAWRLRRGADRRRRLGRPQDAVALLRRAAQADDTPAGWISLAAQLRAVGCYEQALRLLRRAVAMPDPPCEVWIEMARCHAALEEREGAVDCLYRYLNEDPYSDAADEARSLLARMESVGEDRDAFRLPRLVRRGFDAWYAGNEELAMRRLNRAMDIACRPAGLYVSVAIRLMAENRCREAVRYLAAATALEPDNAWAACTLCIAVHGAGKPRAAKGLLRQFMPRCMTPAAEMVFCSAAAILGADDLLMEYLNTRMAAMPCRVALMHRMADVMVARDDMDQARSWWQRILHLDPSDVRAAMLLRHPPRESFAVAAGGWPVECIRHAMMQLLLLRCGDGGQPLEEGSDSRVALDFAFQQHDEGMQKTALEVLISMDSPEADRFMRELLLNPGVAPDVCARIMLHLTRRGDTGPLQALMGQRITTVSCTPVHKSPASRWRMFLVRLLGETAGYRQSETIAALAAGVWPLLTPRQRDACIGREGFQWVKAFEILYLRMTGQEMAAQRVVARLPVSVRKVSRILRAIGRRMEPQVFE